MKGLSEEEQQLARIMLDHSDEYFNQFEFADVLADREFDPESEVNPFFILHSTLLQKNRCRTVIRSRHFSFIMHAQKQVYTARSHSSS